MISIKIKFPEDYPESPPEIIFKTPIYHLNINSSSKTGEPVGKVYTNSLHYWKNYYTKDMARAIDSKPPYTNLKEYDIWVKNLK